MVPLDLLRSRPRVNNIMETMSACALDILLGSSMGIGSIILDIHLNENTAHLMTLQDIEDHMAVFIFEGNDTGGTALQFAIYNIANDSVAQHTIQAEIDTLFAANGIDMIITADHFKQLPFTEAVIKETLGLVPPVPIYSRSLVEDVEFKGHLIPKRTEVWTF